LFSRLAHLAGGTFNHSGRINGQSDRIDVPPMLLARADEVIE
jgi:hypothetical protein